MVVEEPAFRVLFLDLDGVICCNYHGELEAAQLAQVARVCAATDAKVVLSTDWRRHKRLKDRATKSLADVGVEVIGAADSPKTPVPLTGARADPATIISFR